MGASTNIPTDSPQQAQRSRQQKVQLLHRQIFQLTLPQQAQRSRQQKVQLLHRQIVNVQQIMTIQKIVVPKKATYQSCCSGLVCHKVQTYKCVKEENKYCAWDGAASRECGGWKKSASKCCPGLVCDGKFCRSPPTES